MKQILKGSIALILGVSSMTAWAATESANLGPRPLFLVNNMDESPLKTKLLSCSEGPFHRSDFSIGHRGAAMQFPEHTKESYLAAIQMGAGVVECDVTFTKDKALVCRHSQSDLHTTTDVLAHPDLAKKCSVPFKPANPATGEDAQVECRTSDFTLAEFKTLKGKMDGANPKATTVEEYMKGTPGWRTDLYSQSGTLMTHAESAALFKEHGVKVTPELKSAAVEMPFNGFSQEMYAQKLVDES
ncbi:glycerophosphoryl diester phosphodiesterase family protein [Vibrio crassostreae]|nr:glycerophosphoryl diester phosphodiesterase family protein [Vibrio crassostreae]